jgi:WD40 repeat protein
VVTSADGDPHALVFEAETGKPELILRGQDVIPAGLAWSPDGTRIARSGRFGGSSENFEPIRLYDAGTGKEVASLTGHRGAIRHLAYSADGSRLAGGGWDRRIHVWDLTTGQELLFGPGHRGQVDAVAFSPDGKTLASAGQDGTLRLWDTAAAKWQRTLTGHRSAVTGVAFHPEGKLLATGGADGTVRLWDLTTGEGRALEGHPNGWLAVAFSPDGKTLAVASVQGVRLWDPVASKPVKELPTRAPASRVLFSPDGKWLAAGCDSGVLHLWEAATGWELPGPKGNGRDPVLGLAFHPTDPLLAVGTQQTEGSIGVWALTPPHQAQELKGHRGPVQSCAWGPGGKYLISAGWKDGTVRLWDLASAAPRSRAIALGAVEIAGAALSPEGRYLATANADGTIYLLRLMQAGEAVRVP